MKNFVKVLVVASASLAPMAFADWRDTRSENGTPACTDCTNTGSRETRAESGNNRERGNNVGSRETRAEDGTNNRGSDGYFWINWDLGN